MLTAELKDDNSVLNSNTEIIIDKNNSNKTKEASLNDTSNNKTITESNEASKLSILKDENIKDENITTVNNKDQNNVGTTEHDDLSKVKQMRLPVIVKPTDRSGSRGIFKLQSFDELEQKIDNRYKMQGDIKKLEAYYSSEDWKRDFALDEKGKLPKELKRGVLSEDAIYDLLERNKELLATVSNYKD